MAGVLESTPEFLASQLDCVFTDIFPDAVKTGMVSSTGLIEVIADKLKQYGARNIVVDPVMVATSGSRLISQEAVDALKELLLPLATVLTPNIPETEVLSGMTVRSSAEMEAAARAISEKYGCAVLCKGGHQCERRGRPAVAERRRQVVPGPAHRQPQHPRHRLHPLQRPSPPTWPRALTWTRRWSGPRRTSPAHWGPCWTWAAAPAPWTTCLT